MTLAFLPDPDPPYDTPLEVAPGVRRLVARNINPFTVTGTSRYLIGSKTLAVVDPGPDGAASSLLEALGQEEQIVQIWITHTHQDHSPAAKDVKAETGALTYSFGPHGSGRTGGLDAKSGFEGADWDFTPDHRLAHGDILHSEAGDWTAIHTPGHCSNHLCFFRAEDGVLIAGDMVMSMATPLISPPDGDMAAYLASLDRLMALEPSCLLPAHGVPITQPMAFLAGVKAHRLEREARIVSCLTGRPASLPQILAQVYDDVPKALYPAAARSLYAHMIKLVDEGTVTATPDLTEQANFSLL